MKVRNLSQTRCFTLLFAEIIDSLTALHKLWYICLIDFHLHFSKNKFIFHSKKSEKTNLAKPLDTLDTFDEIFPCCPENNFWIHKEKTEQLYSLISFRYYPQKERPKILMSCIWDFNFG